MKKTALQFTSGFTLIELLIVIALLGALAIGLLATVDPLEQLKKGRDTAVRNTVSELYNSFIRFNAGKAHFPWGVTPISGHTMNAAAETGYIQSVIDLGELKRNFLDIAKPNLGRIILSSTDPGTGSYMEDITVCFQPESKSFRGDDNAMYNNAGISQADCPKGTNAACHWCVK